VTPAELDVLFSFELRFVAIDVGSYLKEHSQVMMEA
jgi:hypothetical protein